MGLRAFVVRWSWRLLATDDRAIAKRLAEFARTEQGSFLTLRLAANQTPSAARAALYLRHAADEARHARLLHTCAEELRGHRVPLLADGEDLYALRGELAFLAFVHHAEGRGRRQFEIIAQELGRQGRAATAEVLRRIASEESHHERYSGRLLRELAAGEESASVELARIRRWEAWRLFRRLGRSVAGHVYDAVILALVPILAIYGLVLPRARTGFRSR
jgi:rubrerythrin